jgi:sec-independent protein translocase protein TatA
MLGFNGVSLLAFLPTIGPMEMLIVGGIAVLLFGSRLPEVARSLGKSYVEFKKGLGGISDEVRHVQYEVEQAAETAYYTPVEDSAPAAFDPPPREEDTDAGETALGESKKTTDEPSAL